jgi:tetratricopeptide (TPR) repeat protein
MKNRKWLDDLRRERVHNSARNPGAAALMSFFMPGLGQIYAGHVDRGIFLLGIHFGAIFSAISLYNKGIIYDALFPLVGMKLLVILIYCSSVILILLWIYNIKDAYYLSLFASYRDWFEVEQVLLPVFEKQQAALLTAGENQQMDESLESQMAEPATPDLPEIVPEIDVHEDADVIPITGKKVEEKAEKTQTSANKDEDDSDEEFNSEEVIYFSDLNSISFNRQSWKLYFGVLLIFLLVGVWFFNKKQEATLKLEKSANTLFSVSAKLNPDKNEIKVKSQNLPKQTQLAKAITSKSEKVLATAPSLIPVPKIIDKKPEPKPVQEVANKIEPKPQKKIKEEIKPVYVPFIKALELVKNRKMDEAFLAFENDLQKEIPTKEIWKKVLTGFYNADFKLKYELLVRKFIKQFPEDFEASFNLGKLLYDRKEYAQAAQIIVKGLKSSPDNVRGNYLLGTIYNELGLYDDSVKYLNKAIEGEPLNIEINRELAMVNIASGNFSDAEKNLQRVLSLKPDDQEALDQLTAIRRDTSITAKPVTKKKKITDGVLFVQGKQKAVVIKPSNVKIPQVGEVLFDNNSSKNYAKAIVTKESKKLTEEPVEGKVIFEAPVPADISEVKEIEKNAKVIDKPVIAKTTPKKPVENSVIVKKPAKSDTKKAVGSKEAGEKRIKQLRKRVENSGLSELEILAAANNLHYSNLRDSVAVNESVKKNVKVNKSVKNLSANAVKKAKKVNISKPKNSLKELKEKGFFEYSKGNWEGALPYYLQYLKQKKDPAIYDVVGVIFDKLGMKQDGYDASEQAYKLGKRNFSTLTRLGRLAEEVGRVREGEFYLQKALKSSPNRVDLRIRYARCLNANGKTKGALKELKFILDTNSSSYAVKRKVERELERMGQTL